MGELPHLQAAVSRFKGKPFEILAISVDSTKSAPARMVRSKRMPGIQTWDVAGPENPVANLYNCQAYPTWYLIDANGVIRARDPFGAKLAPAVEAALRASESPKPVKSGARPGP